MPLDWSSGGDDVRRDCGLRGGTGEATHALSYAPAAIAARRRVPAARDELTAQEHRARRALAAVESAERLGLRLVAYDRPGYGGWTPHRGRTVADAADDVAAILDALGAEGFATYGGSGGGPHALACAALLGDRCLAAATIAGFGPADAADLDWLAGMGEGNIAEVAAARAGGERLTEYCRADAEEVMAITPRAARRCVAAAPE
jgi:pimeloyl-ACP methyl ester carboxylesterase